MPTEESREEEASFRHKRIIDGLDEVAMGLASGTISRRRALKLTGTALLGGGLLAMFPGVAGAQSSTSIVDPSDPSVARSDPRCQHLPAVNNRRCSQYTCGGNPDCICAETVGGDKRCVNFLDEQCPDRDECDRNRDCAQGEVCIEIGGCCEGRRRNLCVRLCS